MIKNYLGSTIIYFKNHKSFLFINLIGLTTGLTACYFAFLYVSFELSYALLVNDFLIPIGIGIFLGVPLSWYVMNKWLQGFAYRIELIPGTFLSAGFILLLVAIATIGFQTIKAANADPVRSLKIE